MTKLRVWISSTGPDKSPVVRLFEGWVSPGPETVKVAIDASSAGGYDLVLMGSSGGAGFPAVQTVWIRGAGAKRRGLDVR